MDKIVQKIDNRIERLRKHLANPDCEYNPVLVAISIQNLLDKKQRIVDGIYNPNEESERFQRLFKAIGKGIRDSVNKGWNSKTGESFIKLKRAETNRSIRG